MAKGILSDAEATAMKIATQDAAAVLIDDLQHIREAIGKPQQDAGEIRRLSNLLRRILVEGDLRKIAVPRIGRVEIVAPDLNAIYRANDKAPFPFAAADQYQANGIDISNITVNRGSNPRLFEGHDQQTLTHLRLETFQNQRVICFHGKWATRSDVIKYIANVCSGTHSGSPKEDTHILISNVRHSVTTSIIDGQPSMKFNPNSMVLGVPLKELPFGSLDIALMQLISTARFMTASPDVYRLEESIAQSG